MLTNIRFSNNCLGNTSNLSTNVKQISKFSPKKIEKKTIRMQLTENSENEKQKLGPEKVYFEGPPSKVELIIPFFFNFNSNRDNTVYYYIIKAVLGNI